MAARPQIAAAVSSALSSLGITVEPGDVHLERPVRREHGDWSTNVALVKAKAVGEAPRQLAERLADALRAAPPPHLASVDVAGPGFVNVHLDPGWLHATLVEVIEAGQDGYARSEEGKGERVQIEFISANPTGPLHVGNGWWGSYGDAMGRVLARCGWDVHREYYVNDTGGQIRALGDSVLARRRGQEVPEGGYQGAYVADLAASYDGPDEVEAAGRWASERIIGNIRRTVERMGIAFDAWYSQASIEESGAVQETIDLLRAKDLVDEEGGAVWFRSSRLGDNRDRVLVKSNGDPTYLAGDLAYHRDKFLVRGFDRVIDIFGADHAGQVKSLELAMEALGVPPGRLEVKIGQMVQVIMPTDLLADAPGSGADEAGESAGGEPGGGEDGQDGGAEQGSGSAGKAVRMSKRAGNFVALDTLIDDIGVDATRLLSLMSSLDQSTTVDIRVVREQSMENPVYYVQYAYARICSIERVRAERGIDRRPLAHTDLGLLVHPRELEVLRALEILPDVVADAGRDRAPHKVTAWVRDLAGTFHGFYHDCPVLADAVGEELGQARLWLVEAARVGFVIGLGLLGVSAPESM
ncbi:MAG TPA: arginine--tRNA ligase [Acidimicrobiales bacterium]|nr:arginine--tRNA ligase [Acidimicrobiales bacterium]